MQTRGGEHLSIPHESPMEEARDEVFLRGFIHSPGQPDGRRRMSHVVVAYPEVSDLLLIINRTRERHGSKCEFK